MFVCINTMDIVPKKAWNVTCWTSTDWKNQFKASIPPRVLPGPLSEHTTRQWDVSFISHQLQLIPSPQLWISALHVCKPASSRRLRHLVNQEDFPEPLADNSLSRLKYVLKGILRAGGSSQVCDQQLPILPWGIVEVWLAGGSLLKTRCCGQPVVSVSLPFYRQESLQWHQHKTGPLGHKTSGRITTPNQHT